MGSKEGEVQETGPRHLTWNGLPSLMHGRVRMSSGLPELWTAAKLGETPVAHSRPSWEVIEMDEDRIRTSDVPTGQIPSAENPRPMRFKCCGYWQALFILPIRCAICGKVAVKAVAADTNEECETGSLPHTGTKK